MSLINDINKYTTQTWEYFKNAKFIGKTDSLLYTPSTFTITINDYSETFNVKDIDGNLYSLAENETFDKEKIVKGINVYSTHPEEAIKFEKLMKPKTEYTISFDTATNVTPDFTYDGTYSWQTPVTDRVLQNAINVRQKIADEKGVFSDTVWNRIKGNQIVLKYLIAWYRNNVPRETIYLYVNKQTTETRQAWADFEAWITESDLNDMATNDRALMDGMVQPHANYLEPKNDYIGGIGVTSTTPTWNDLNILEHTLKQIYDMVVGAIEMWRYSGEVICSSNTQQIDIL